MVALGSTGDIEMQNRVISIQGMKIIVASDAAPSSVGNWHTGDLAVDVSGTLTPGRVWIYNSSWQQIYPQPTFFSGGIAAAPNAATNYFAISVLNNTETVVQTVTAIPITYSSLYVALSANVGGAADSLTVTLRKNGADTAITTAIATGSKAGHDTAHSVTFAAGDLLSFKVVTTANGGGSTVNACLS